MASLMKPANIERTDTHLSKVSQKLRRRKYYPLIYESGITLIPKTKKTYKQRKPWANMTTDHKQAQKFSSSKNEQTQTKSMFKKHMS